MHELEFGLTGFYPLFDGLKRATLHESLGFDIQGFSENHSRSADCFGEMRDAARGTSRIRLACGPVNFVTRNPGVVAAGVLPIQIISGGRAICNLAAGDSAVAAAGKAPQRIDDMERDVRILRTLLDGEAVDLDDREVRLEWAVGQTWDRVPIQICASGPRSLAMAARNADRICIGVGCDPARVAWAMEVIGEALAAAGRDRKDIRIGMFAPIAIAEDRPTAVTMLRPRVAAWAHMQSGKGVDLSAQPEILRKVTSVLRHSYDYSHHHPDAAADNPNSAVCDEIFADWIGIGGPVSYVTDRMAQLVEMGVDFFMTAVFGQERELYAAEVIPALRRLRPQSRDARRPQPAQA
jgi:alkanesulfonate monooxygenase SsuD/methylene tetrahydromethanopterin reductase-like flavin-dependent oxidoreductase (luciferase family)